MSDEFEPDEIFDEEDIFERHQNDLMEMFDEASFSEKWRRVREGLKMPPTTGPYKWARLQMLRLLSPIMAVVFPVFMLFLMILFSKFGPEPNRSVKVKVVDPEPIEELEDIEDPVIEEIEPPDPVEIEIINPDVSLPPSEVAAPPQDVTVQQAEFDSVAITKSPMVMTGIYGSRNPGSRAAAINKYGGSGTEGAVLRALRYMKKNQRSDGSWGQSKVAMTSMALLAYLAHGDTPSSPEFGSTVKSAISFIIDAQRPGGSFAGRDGNDYTQPIGAYALAEAYAVTKIPRLKTAAVKAVIPVVKGQNASGGFNYKLIPSTRDDTSYMGWCIQALKSAKMAGLYGDVPGLKECMHKAVKGFQKNYGERDGYGGFGYTAKSFNHGLSGVGVLCLQFLGAANTKECKGGLNGLSRWKFDWDHPDKCGFGGHSFVYYMYYVTQAKFQQGGSSWKDWNKQFAPSLMKNQKIIQKDASGYVDHTGQKRAIGSWTSPSKSEHTANNDIMPTILCTLMLEVYYRYLPTFMAAPAEDVEEEIGDEDDIGIDFGYYVPAKDEINRNSIAASGSCDLNVDAI